MAWSQNIPVGTGWCFTDLANWEPFFDLLNSFNPVLEIYGESSAHYNYTSQAFAELVPSALYRCIAGGLSSTSLIIPEQIIYRCLDIVAYCFDKDKLAEGQGITHVGWTEVLLGADMTKFFTWAEAELPSGTSTTILHAIRDEQISSGPDWSSSVVGCFSKDLPNTLYAMCEALRKNFAVHWVNGGQCTGFSTGGVALYRNDFTSVDSQKKGSTGVLTRNGHTSCETTRGNLESAWTSTSCSSDTGSSSHIIVEYEPAVPEYFDPYIWTVRSGSARWRLVDMNFGSYTNTFSSFEYRMKNTASGTGLYDDDVFFDPFDDAPEKTIQNIQTITPSGNYTSPYVGDICGSTFNPISDLACGDVPEDESARCISFFAIVMELEVPEP